MTREKNVPGNPHECRLNAAHCSELAKTVVTSECQSLLVLADTWKRLEPAPGVIGIRPQLAAL